MIEAFKLTNLLNASCKSTELEVYKLTTAVFIFDKVSIVPLCCWCLPVDLAKYLQLGDYSAVDILTIA